MEKKHIPVMLNEALFYLDCKPGKIYVDCTLGGAGHAKAIMERIMPDGLLIGIDQDKNAVENAAEFLKSYESNIRLFNDNFIALPEILSELNINSVDGILIDLGISRDQIESGRGFTFNADEPLDMRMNPQAGITAQEIVNDSEEDALEKIFREYGEERFSRLIARRIIKERKKSPIYSTSRLSQIICSAVSSRRYKWRIHPATQTFMALRIAVNKELEVIDSFMRDAVAKNNAAILNPGARLCVISFHSLEDRIIKRWIKKLEKGCVCPPDFPICICNGKKLMRSLTPKPCQPTQAEIAVNPPARSAKLRAAEKI